MLESRTINLLSSPESMFRRNEIVEYLLDLAAGGTRGHPPVRGEDDLIMALAIVRAVSDKSFSSRFFLEMRNDLEERLSSISFRELEESCQSIGLTVAYDTSTSQFSIPFYEFVKYTKRISGTSYRLVYQNIRGGIITTSRDVIVHIAREAYVQRLQERFSSFEDNIANEVSRILNGIPETIASIHRARTLASDSTLGGVSPELFPPCIKEYIKEMKDGVNLPHMARFTLVTFLHHIGMNIEEIEGLFRTAPDFNEKLTMYQVNHITGKTSGTEYSPPKCTVLQSNHLCYKGEDPLCNQEWMKHPLQYYTIKKRPRKPKASAQ